MFLLCVLLCSCGSSDIPMNYAMKEPYIVESIDIYPIEGYCQYNLGSVGGWSINFANYIAVYDSIGKFVVGDTVRLDLKKSK